MVLGVVLSSCMGREASAQAECASAVWEPSVGLAGPGIVLRSPQLSVGHQGLVLAGNNLPDLGDTPLPQPLLLVFNGEGRDLGRPEGEFQFLIPRLVSDSAGVTHMIWAEAKNPVRSPREAPLPLVSDLWYAYLKDGQWSQPQHLYHAYDVTWYDGSGAVTVGANATLYLTFGAIPDSAAGGGKLMILSGGPSQSWRTRVVWDGAPGYVSLTRLGSVLHLAAVAWDSVGGRNTLLVTRSTDNGVRWSKPVRMHPFGDELVMRTWLLSHRDRLHMVWMLNREIGAGPYAIRHAVSLDEGATWSDFTDLPVDGVVNSAVTLDACGQVHVVSSIAGESGIPRLTHHRFDGVAWVAGDLPTQSPVSSEPALATGANGEVVLTWVEFRDRSQGGPSLVTMMSRLAAR